jgi:hypothetical protein
MTNNNKKEEQVPITEMFSDVFNYDVKHSFITRMNLRLMKLFLIVGLVFIGGCALLLRLILGL